MSKDEPRSRLWWHKTLRIMRIPAGAIAALFAETAEPLTSEDGHVLLFEEL